MTSPNTIAKAITAAIFCLVTGTSAAAQNSSGGVTADEFNNVSRLVERLSARVDALEEKNRTLKADLKELREKDRALENTDTELNQRISALAVPDVVLLKATLNTIRSNLENHERALAAIDDKNAAQDETIAKLTNSGATYASGIVDLQSADRTLRGQGALLAKRLDALDIPDLGPLVKELSAIKAVNDDQSETIDGLVSREEALMVAATGLQAQIDDIALPDLNPFEAALSSLHSRLKTHESAVSLIRRKLEDHDAMISELNQKDNALMVAATGLQAQIDDLDIADSNTIKADITALKTNSEQMTQADKIMRIQIDNLIGLDVPRLSVDVDELKHRLSGITRAGDTLRFDAMNVQVTSGSGATDAEVNGLGNVIIGYNETIDPFVDDVTPASDKSGSHNLVVGKGHNYPSYGSVVAGLDNVAAGNFSVAAGTRNQALGDFSTVTGGQLNNASGWYSSVSGGFKNVASENSASVSGGQLNAAAGAASSISGGFQVRAPGNSNWAAGQLFQQQ